MEGYFDNTPPLASPRVYDSAPRARRYDESAMLRYLLSGSSSSDNNTTPRNRSTTSRSSSGGCSSLRGSPLSSLEKFPRRRSEMAVKIEGDVLVMDAIPVRSMARASCRPLSLDSAAKASPPMADYSCLGKREICRSWESFGSCLYGPKCKFAHGKEEIDPRILTKPKCEMAHTKENEDPRITRNPQSEFADSKEKIDLGIITVCA